MDQTIVSFECILKKKKEFSSSAHLSSNWRSGFWLDFFLLPWMHKNWGMERLFQF